MIQHDALLHFRYHFIALQIELALSSGNIKYAKTTCRKAIQQVSQSHIPFPLWHYRFLFTLVDICENYEKDYSATLAALQELLAFSSARGDDFMHWIVKLQMARIAILKGDEQSSASLVKALLQATGYKLNLTNAELEEAEKQHLATPGQPKINPLDAFNVELTEATLRLPRPVIMQFVILLCIWQGHIGEMKAAKSNLKKVHALLDTPDSKPGELEGWIEVHFTLNDARNVTDAHLCFVDRFP